MPKTVAVVFGGISNENEISVITGTMAANILKKGGDTAVPVYISLKGEMFAGDGLEDINNFKNKGYVKFPHAAVCAGGIYLLKKNGKFKKFIKVDVALNCCHGGLGEGGGVCGLFALNGIPVAGAGMFESAAFMDKYFTKLVLSSLGVKTAPYVYVRSAAQAEEGESLGFPLIVKPARLGSSIGIARADDLQSLKAAVECALTYDDGVLIEKYIENRREINCAAYYTAGIVVTSECEEAFAGGDILSYDDKYAGGGRAAFPAEIPGETSDKIRALTSEVYVRLNMRGIVRFDYILDGEDVILSEVNTVPGSLSYYLLSSGFKDFYPVLQAVIVQAEEDLRAAANKVVLETGILNNIRSNACKTGRK